MAMNEQEITERKEMKAQLKKAPDAVSQVYEWTRLGGLTLDQFKLCLGIIEEIEWEEENETDEDEIL